MGYTTYKGIDYSGRNSTVNRDSKTDIRYGVISQNEVLQTWADSSEPVYTYHCPHCGAELKKGPEQKRCGSCHKNINPDHDFDFIEPDGFMYKKEGYAAMCGSDGDVMICKSPYFTYAQFCSPCAPGACYLMNPLTNADPVFDKNNRAYCFGHDWFEGDAAPYPVYSVETGERIYHK